MILYCLDIFVIAYQSLIMNILKKLECTQTKCGKMWQNALVRCVFLLQYIYDQILMSCNKIPGVKYYTNKKKHLPGGKVTYQSSLLSLACLMTVLTLYPLILATIAEWIELLSYPIVRYKPRRPAISTTVKSSVAGCKIQLFSIYVFICRH